MIGVFHGVSPAGRRTGVSHRPLRKNRGRRPGDVRVAASLPTFVAAVRRFVGALQHLDSSGWRTAPDRYAIIGEKEADGAAVRVGRAFFRRARPPKGRQFGTRSHDGASRAIFIRRVSFRQGPAVEPRRASRRSLGSALAFTAGSALRSSFGRNSDDLSPRSAVVGAVRSAQYLYPTQHADMSHNPCA